MDIAAAADRLYVCTGRYGRAIVYSQDSGSILTEYTTGQDRSEARSMAVNIQHQIVAVLWDRKQVAVYSINSNNCLVIFNVESGVSRIRISDNGRIVTGNINTGEVKVFSLTQFFTYDNLKVTLSSLLSDSDQEKLVKYFKIRDDSLKDDRDHSNDSDDNDDSDGMGDGKKKARLLTILEKKGLLQDRNFQDLKQAFSHLGIWNTSMVMSHIDFYQQHTEKNASSDLQTSEDNESDQELQLDGFSADWSACDMSIGICGNMVVVAGYCRNPDKTSLDFICKSDSDSWTPWVKTKEFEGVSNAERIVSFIEDYKVVTCCGNVIEIINFDTNETEMKQTLESSDSIATCITVRKGDVYIGFNKSAKILVLNRELQDRMTVTLNDIKSMWPMDLVALSGKLLVCLKDNSTSQVILFNEENGQKLVEYRNVEDGNRAPQSVAACEETDLVGILWPADAGDYEEKPYGHIALHSLKHGYCLSLAAVASSVHDFECDCYPGCSSGKRLGLTSEHAVVMDDLGGIKFFSMKEILSEENLSYVLSQTLSFDDRKGFRKPEEESVVKGNNSCGNSHDFQQDGNGEDVFLKNFQKMSKLCKFLTILRVKGHVDSDIITNLTLKFTQLEDSSNNDSVREVDAEGEPLKCYRFQWYDYFDNYDDDYDEECRNGVDVSFGSNNKIAVSHFRPRENTSHFRPRENTRSVCIYHWDRNKKLQPSLSFYRKFEDGGSKVFVSFLHEYQAVTCCYDLIEITDFGAHGKTIKSHRLNSAATCMATKDGDIFVCFKSSKIVVLDSELVEKRSVVLEVKNWQWPNDLTVIPDKLFVCTWGTLQRAALSFNMEDGRQLMEYTYDRSQMYGYWYPLSITVNESLDLVGVSWCNDDGDINEITLHSLSRGFCVAVVKENSAHIIRFSQDNYLLMVSRHGDSKYSPAVSTSCTFMISGKFLQYCFDSLQYILTLEFHYILNLQT
ncbi:hypothetical protein HOLleu_20948 [Holothuria leucospilota]|uniref:Uncharacterized protein n=1 Tax=Holothuria leucospilota TaxID=206669 RepID=A0A9Q1BWV3_HOLLE|nr:hypothetical protein HOLleu_20948 [Holothuria leucospilota]